MLAAEPCFSSAPALAALPRLCLSLLNSLSTLQPGGAVELVATSHPQPRWAANVASSQPQPGWAANVASSHAQPSWAANVAAAQPPPSFSHEDPGRTSKLISYTPISNAALSSTGRRSTLLAMKWLSEQSQLHQQHSSHKHVHSTNERLTTCPHSTASSHAAWTQPCRPSSTQLSAPTEPFNITSLGTPNACQTHLRSLSCSHTLSSFRMLHSIAHDAQHDNRCHRCYRYLQPNTANASACNHMSSHHHSSHQGFEARCMQRHLHRWLKPPSKRATFDEHAVHPSIITRLIMETESVQQLETTVQSYAEDFNHIHVVTALGRLAKLADKSSRHEEDPTLQMLVDALSSAYLRFIDRYDARNLASGVWACSKLHYCPEDLLLEVMYQLMANGGAKLLEANPQTLATLASSFGQLHFEAKEFWSMLAHVVQARVRDFNPQDIAGTAWGFAKAHRYRLNLFELLASCAMLRMKDFNAHDMATLAWAFAQVGHVDHQLMTSLAIQAESHIHTFLPHQLSILLWSYAKLHISNPSLYQALVQAVQSNIQYFNPQSLANVAWAHARMRMQNDELLKAITKRSLEQKRLDNQAMATLVWAFARLGYSNPELLQKVSKQARTQAEVLTPLDLVNITWSLAQSGHYDKDYMKAAAMATLIKLPVLSAHHATLLLWSFAKLGHYDVELFQEMCKHTRDKLLLFSGPQLAGILWSLSKVGHNDEDTIAAILKQLIPRLSALSKRDLISTTLSLSRLQCSDAGIWESLAARVADVAQEGQLVASEVARLLQSFVDAGHRHPEVYSRLVAAADSLMSSKMFGPFECRTVLKSLEGLTDDEVSAMHLSYIRSECLKFVEENGLQEPNGEEAVQIQEEMTHQAHLVNHAVQSGSS